MIFKIPLDWLQLTREKLRLLVALAGIGFASMLITQLGLRSHPSCIVLQPPQLPTTQL